MYIAIHKKTGERTEITKEQKEKLSTHGSFLGSYRFEEKQQRGKPPVSKKIKNDNS